MEKIAKIGIFFVDTIFYFHKLIILNLNKSKSS